jgi:hypothetical protein
MFQLPPTLERTFFCGSFIAKKINHQNLKRGGLIWNMYVPYRRIYRMLNSLTLFIFTGLRFISVSVTH